MSATLRNTMPGDEHSDLDFGPTIRGFAAGQKVVGRYVLKRILGRGGMGVVWLAQDEELEIPVALKFLPEEISRDAEAVASLKRETRRGLELSHPHIVKTYGFVKDDRSAAIAMEYVDGKTLSALKASREERPWFEVEEIAPWVLAICQALDYAHNRAKVIHRDLKPINVMLSAQGEIKITDFGVAQVLHDSYSRVSMTAASSGGTLIYMSPQQALGERPRVADDIYSLGAMIYDLLSGKAPFGGNPSTIYIQVRDRVPPPLAERREELSHAGAVIPPEWEQTVSACLAKELADRPGSAMEVAERLGLAGGYRALGSTTETLAEQPQTVAEAAGNDAPDLATVQAADPEKPETVPAPESKAAVKRQRKWRRKLAATLIVLLAGGALADWWFQFEKPKLREERYVQALAAKAQRDKDHDAAKALAGEAEREKKAAAAKAQATQAGTQQQQDGGVPKKAEQQATPALGNSEASAQLKAKSLLAGTWTGVLQGENGSERFTVSISADEKKARTEIDGPGGTQVHNDPCHREGETLVWNLSSLVKCTLRFNENGSARFALRPASSPLSADFQTGTLTKEK